jgi:UDP:flavonoid glycosyltransferase YjiC (YdhE family)
MKVLFTSLREKSHFLAMVPFIEACQRQRHTVAVSAPPDFAERVAALGAQFLPFGHPGDAALAPIWARFRTTPLSGLWGVAIGEVFAGPCAGAAVPALLETIASFRPSLIVRESHEFAGLIAAEKLGVPHIRAAICAPISESQIADHAASAVNAHRQTWGLPADPSGERMRTERAITLFPPSFEVAHAAPGLASFQVARPKAPPLPSWWGGRKGPFVYATFGTVTGGFERSHAVYRVALAALADLPVRVLLTTGSLPPEILAEVPPNVHIEPFVAQDEVVPHASVVLCHGGAGTVLGALAAGVPLVVTPLFADQPNNAERVAAIGAGLAIPEGDLSPESLRAALSRVLQGAPFRAAAQRIASEIAALPTVDEVPATLERYSALVTP